MPWLPGLRPGLFPGSVIAIKATGRRSPPVSNVKSHERTSSVPDWYFWYFTPRELVEPGSTRRIGQHLLDDVLAQRRLARQLDRIFAVEASGAQPRSRLLGSRNHAPQRDVAQCVGPDGMSYRLEHLFLVLDGVGDQLGR